MPLAHRILVCCRDHERSSNLRTKLEMLHQDRSTTSIRTQNDLEAAVLELLHGRSSSLFVDEHEMDLERYRLVLGLRTCFPDKVLMASQPLPEWLMLRNRSAGEFSLAPQPAEETPLSEEFTKTLRRFSHDVMSPLTAIKGFAELLHEGLIGDLTPDQADLVLKIKIRGDEIKTRVDDFRCNVLGIH